MGRPPKPIERHKATGRNATTKANGDKLPEPYKGPIDRTVPAPPEELYGRAAVEWEKIWTAGYWLHRDVDYHWVEQIVQAYADIEVFRAQVRQDGLVTKGYAGQDAAHPLIAEIRKCQTQIQTCLSKLGFSPADRAKLAITEAKARSALQELIASSRG